MTTFSVSPVRLSVLSLGALLLALAPLRTACLKIDFDFSELRFGTAEVEAQLAERNDAK